ncbi:co-chaperone DjlA [Enterobacteriaceae endosymbiont of Macroplea mutica]|nr:co-chaperone DjlA [Enterobacteriaceae endosymbiont of Macroplea mutica]
MRLRIIMSYWGRLIGFIIGLMTSGNFLHVLFYTSIGYLFDKFFIIHAEWYNNNYTINHKKTFIQITFEVMGYISKSKGFVTKKDIIITTNIMQQLHLNDRDIILAQHYFNHGKQIDYPLIHKLNCLYYKLIDQQNLLHKFIFIQVQLAYANHYLDPKTEQILRIIFRELHVSYHEMNNIFDNIYSRNFFSQKNNYQYNHFSPKNTTTELMQAYKTLQVNQNDSMLIIKKKYYKLMSKYHPDKYMSQKYSLKELEAAKRKTQKIQHAYNIIKKYKK